MKELENYCIETLLSNLQYESNYLNIKNVYYENENIIVIDINNKIKKININIEE